MIVGIIIRQDGYYNYNLGKCEYFEFVFGNRFFEIIVVNICENIIGIDF
jgi:hypothetical protein